MTLFNLCTCCLIFPQERFSGLACNPLPICGECREAIDGLKTPSGSTSLFYYRHPISTLIHRAKIRDDIPALWLLANLFAKSEISQSCATAASYILPAPSSLWGRLRGRFDIAWISANELSRSRCKPLLEASLRSYCNINKRALIPVDLRKMLQEESRQLKLSRSSQTTMDNHPSGAPTNILIVDDVVTSGKTIEGLRSNLLVNFPEASIQILTVADARQPQRRE